MALLAVCNVFFGLLMTTLAHRVFQDKIPNGDNVLHPCKINYRWHGVGHENPKGGGKLNLFGLDFQKEGNTWTKRLCGLDSDGDGKTNGEELGDPSCTWEVGKIPTRTSDITNPGVCDPYGSELCKGKNSFVSCELDRFESCAAINKTGVSKLDLKFVRTRIPPIETQYNCMTFDLPDDKDYHIIATEPIIDNANLVHHMLLFGCENREDLDMSVPKDCGMGTTRNCETLMGGWTVGQSGSCYGNNVGFRIGQSSYKQVRLQIHYNNPKLVENYTDASGLRLYYQPAAADVQNLTMLMIGQQHLEIPPGQSRVEQVGKIPSSCTQFLLIKPAYVVSALNHMHYLGKSMYIEVFRDGAKIKELTNDTHYSYDSPVDHFHDPVFELRPGDEITTTCVYSSLSTNRTVRFGNATSDEMCFGFVTMYPQDAVVSSYAISNGSMSVCKIHQTVCNWHNFINFATSEKIFNDVTKNCNSDSFCRPECCKVIWDLKNNPCLQNENLKWIKPSLQQSDKGVQFLSRLDSCGAPCSVEDDGQASATTPTTLVSLLLLLIQIFVKFI